VIARVVRRRLAHGCVDGKECRNAVDYCRGGYNHGEPLEELDPPPDAIVDHLGEVLAMYRAARTI